MKKNYWKQTATPWVSIALLGGGLATALLLFMLVKIESRLGGLESRFDILVEQGLPGGGR